MPSDNICNQKKLVGTSIPEKAQTECEMIYLREGDWGIFKFEKGPKDVMKFIVPSPYIRTAVEDWLIETFQIDETTLGLSRDGFTRNISYRVGQSLSPSSSLSFSLSPSISRPPVPLALSLPDFSLAFTTSGSVMMRTVCYLLLLYQFLLAHTLLSCWACTQQQ